MTSIAPQKTETSHYQKNLKDLTVLVVDDLADMRALIRMMLGDLGVTHAFEAADGREALGILRAAPEGLDLIICDWNMPWMNGVQLLHEARKLSPGLPVLMVTGRGNAESVLEARSSGVTGYIRKPFTIHQLEAKLRAIVQPMDS